MWLLRDSARYSADRYEVVEPQHRARIRLRVRAVPYLTQMLAEAHDSRSRGPGQHPPSRLPSRVRKFRFGEIELRLRSPALHLGLGEPRQLPLYHDWSARLRLPVRALVPECKQLELRRFRYPYGVVRDFSDFLTAVTGSYVTAYRDGVADKPLPNAHNSELALPGASFELSEAAEYARLFDKFMSLPWRQHLALVDAFRCYRLALGLSAANASVSYFLLVAALESCASRFLDSQPHLDDFSEQVRRAVASWQRMHHVADDVADDLRHRLLEAEKGKLASKRHFIDVVRSYLPLAFWERNDRTSAPPLPGVRLDTGQIVEVPGCRIDPERLDEHLSAVYNSRSKFVHTASEFKAQVVAPGYDWVPSKEYNPDTGAARDRTQLVPTVHFFADMTRAVLVSILDADHSHFPDSDVDPEAWLLGTAKSEFADHDDMKPFTA